ncbi:hypothetical protein THAOC_34281 [Thalassiosira oceanica]|uniref:Uncharacterized protein n=1 Tax=Thalassiosira oceanica TaxID=159749 RepID=K0RJZ8_THAOC|nr:hypothetical protein THAOC_34281 [Thalassiosira oceanica]|eukprot:EJK47027.1 hypothetical protein THAOC_34281 [Thalassiosira oceanica]
MVLDSADLPLVRSAGSRILGAGSSRDYVSEASVLSRLVEPPQSDKATRVSVDPPARGAAALEFGWGVDIPDMPPDMPAAAALVPPPKRPANGSSSKASP